MSNKAPQPTAVLVKRLRRVATWLNSEIDRADPKLLATARARANTCWQAAARLEELEEEITELAMEIPEPLRVTS